MQVQHTRHCAECGFATMFDWELEAHLKATGHRKRRYFTPFSRWVINRWVRVSTGRKIAASTMLAAYLVLSVMFLEIFVPVTLVFGLLAGFTLKGAGDSPDEQKGEGEEGRG